MDSAKFMAAANLGTTTSNSPASHTKQWPGNFSVGFMSRPCILASSQSWILAVLPGNGNAPRSTVPRSKKAVMRSTVRRSKKAVIRCENGVGGDLNRRHLLLASTSTLGLSGLHLKAVEKGASLPMPPPDLSLCHTPDSLPSGVDSLNCCPPFSETAIDFQFPANLPMRVRQAAHMVDGEYIEKYSRAVKLMKELPADDPRNFTQQANVHCAYCDGAYYTGPLPLELDVHNSWFFLPWHRWYLYFHERILAKLIEDDTFALPFWNWDSPEGMTIPSMYVNSQPLCVALRDAAHQPPTPVDLNFDGTDKQQTVDELIASNNNLMYRQIVSGAKTASLFQGLPYRYGYDKEPGAGTLENSPHGTVHVWTGDRNQPNGEDMGNFYSAARDPIFYAHHANVDRMWTIWKTLGGRREDYSDKDFLNSKFLFYDENAQLVQVKVIDALDPRKLRFSYQKVDIPWLNARPVASKKSRVSSLAGVPRAASAADDIAEFGSQPKQLLRPLQVRVKRPKMKRSQAEKEEIEEVLLIEGVEVKRDRALKFDVFINLPEADSTTPISRAEYAGTFVNVPHHGHKHAAEVTKNKGSPRTGYRKSSFRIGITEILDDLGANEADSIIVTLVPKGNISDAIKISGIKIVYD